MFIIDSTNKLIILETELSNKSFSKLMEEHSFISTYLAKGYALKFKNMFAVFFTSDNSYLKIHKVSNTSEVSSGELYIKESLHSKRVKEAVSNVAANLSIKVPVNEIDNSPYSQTDIPVTNIDLHALTSKSSGKVQSQDQGTNSASVMHRSDGSIQVNLPPTNTSKFSTCSSTAQKVVTKTNCMPKFT